MWYVENEAVKIFFVLYEGWKKNFSLYDIQ